MTCSDLPVKMCRFFRQTAKMFYFLKVSGFYTYWKVPVPLSSMKGQSTASPETFSSFSLSFSRDQCCSLAASAHGSFGLPLICHFFTNMSPDGKDFMLNFQKTLNATGKYSDKS